MKVGMLVIAVFWNCMIVSAQDPGMYLLKADKLYKDSSYQDAEEHYRQAHAIKPGFKSYYNIGNSLYQQGRSQEAIDYYKNSLSGESDPLRQAKAFYNLGNAYFHNQQFDKSIDAYKEALKRKPSDNDARNNLMLAKKQLMQQQQQQQQQEQKSSENKETQEPQSQQEQKSKNKEEQQMQNQDPSPSKMNKEQMEQLLRMAGEQDQKTRQKLQKAQSKSPKRTKDW